jgi:hypothetical protein
MKNVKSAVRVAVFIFISGFVILSGIPAHGYVHEEQIERYSKVEITQLLAPIALYPDSLLAQILMASTYPLEVVEAERWLHRHKGIKGDELYSALQEKDWDTSIKSLCNFPDLIFALSEKIEQTRRLGDVFLSQEKDVMDTVQELRRIAYKQGKLKTTREQKVIIEQEFIKIEPSSTRVVYVPVYDPLYVYGQWMYPASPPYYCYYPVAYATSVRHVCFQPAISININWVLWTWFDWSSHHICIVSDCPCRHHRPIVHNNTDHNYWRHDPRHRIGFDHRDRGRSERIAHRPPHFTPPGSATVDSSLIEEREPSRPSVTTPGNAHPGHAREGRIQPPPSRENPPAITRDETTVPSHPSVTTPGNAHPGHAREGRIQPPPSRENPPAITRDETTVPSRPSRRPQENPFSLYVRPERERTRPDYRRDNSSPVHSGGFFRGESGSREARKPQNSNTGFFSSRQETADSREDDEISSDNRRDRRESIRDRIGNSRRKR